MGISNRDALRKASKPVLHISWELCDPLRGSPKPAKWSAPGDTHKLFSPEGPQILMGDCGPRRSGGIFDRTGPSGQ
nr:unnamed protein product [Haemonchus contortus]